MRTPAYIARAIARQQEARVATRTEHAVFIRALPCAACGKAPPSECALIGFHPGLGLPPDERCLVPLCGPASLWQDCCHSRKHFRGAAHFWAGLGIDAGTLALRLWRASGDLKAGEREIRQARRRLGTAHPHGTRPGNEVSRRKRAIQPLGKTAPNHHPFRWCKPPDPARLPGQPRR